MAYKEFRGIGPNKYGSPLKQEGGKFSTTAHDYGKRAAKMSKKERSDYREGLAKGLPFAAGVTPVGRVAGVAAGVVKRNIGGGAHAIGQGLVRKFGTKKMKKTYDMLTNTPRQSVRKAVTPKAPKTYGKNIKRNYNTQPKLTQAQKDLHSVRQSEYLKQQFAKREVGSASSRLQKKIKK